jgi:hypothetical protein
MDGGDATGRRGRMDDLAPCFVPKECLAALYCVSHLNGKTRLDAVVVLREYGDV